ncbi:MAG: FecR domain-containing protein [Elusimicrobia bacterium]|nr:FecR domain-containing protein [Elusimicrobiota bacterium]
MKLLATLVVLTLAVEPALAAGPIRLVPNGAVDVRSGAGTEWRPVAGEEVIAAGMEVRTHRDSTAQLKFEDGSVVQIANYSIFAVDKTDKVETSFSLKLGRIRAAFAGLLSSRVAIKTPTAVCAVRGTVFDVGVSGQDTQVTMAEGVLEVKDNKGKEAVVTSEESLKIGANGMEKPTLVPLNSPDALAAVRPYQVHQENARDATRRMFEDLRNRELKANEAQLGKSVVDAYGRRVRLEEYLLRPDTKSFKLLFLSKRDSRFDWGHLIQTFNSAIPDDLSQVPLIVKNQFLAKTQPSNWLKQMEFYATNTIDAEKEVIDIGAPAQINFSGYNGGVTKMLWYPSSVDFTQTLMGPGVPGGSRKQFVQHQDWNATTANQFTWIQYVQPNATTTANPAKMITINLNPTSVADVSNGFTNFAYPGGNSSLYDNTNADPTAFPSGKTKADILNRTVYSDNIGLTNSSWVSVRKTLVSNEGKILDFNDPTSDLFNKNSSFNLEIGIRSNLFQGRDIDVLIAPEILRAKKDATTTPDAIKL